MLRVTVEHSGLPGMPGFTNFHFGGSTAGEATAANEACRLFWLGLQDTLNNDMESRGPTEVVLVDPATGLATDAFPVTQWLMVYTQPGEPLPYATQGLVRFRTASYNAGRRILGRCYVPGFTEVSNVNGAPDGNAVAVMDAAVEDLALAASAAGDFGVYSRTAGLFADLESHSAWAEWAVLRSRRD